MLDAIDTSVGEELKEEMVEFRKIITKTSRKIETKTSSGRIANDGLSMYTQMVTRNKKMFNCIHMMRRTMMTDRRGAAMKEMIMC